MKILLCGANGFIGRALARRLRRAGHEVIGTARRPPDRKNWIAADFNTDHSPEDWLPRLEGIDMVINAAGILREGPKSRFVDVHYRAPIALFNAAVKAKLKKVIQISALGADEGAESEYHQSKKKADDYLAALRINWTIVQPSLVYGPGGTSAQLFNQLAALPILLLPAGGKQLVQPIHIDDLCEAVLRLIDNDANACRRIPLVGPEPISLRDWLLSLRKQMNLGSVCILPVPMLIMRPMAAIAGLFNSTLLAPDTLRMLQRGNTASDSAVRTLLGHQARPVNGFIPPNEARHAADSARIGWLLPLMRWSVALLWIVTGILSLGFYPVKESYALLEQVHIRGSPATIALYGAAALDIALGLGVLFLRGRRWLWQAQIAVMLCYTALITIFLPAFWLHPFGPLLKNIPLLVLMLALLEFERRA